MPDTVRLQQRTLEETAHRPWPLADGPWVQGQTWCDLLFAHWSVDPEQLRRVMPPGLPLHLYDDGSAWLGVTPFLVSGLRPRGLPPLPWLSRFPELNVRTYVELDGSPASTSSASTPAVRRPCSRRGARTGFRTSTRGCASSATGSESSTRASASTRPGRRPRSAAPTGRPARSRTTSSPAGSPSATARTPSAARGARCASRSITRRGRCGRRRPSWTRPGWPRSSRSEPLLHFSGRQDTLIWPPKRA